MGVLVMGSAPFALSCHDGAGSRRKPHDTIMDAVGDDAVETEVSLAFGLQQAR
jgi:hypothetical protein